MWGLGGKDNAMGGLLCKNIGGTGGRSRRKGAKRRKEKGGVEMELTC